MHLRNGIPLLSEVEAHLKSDEYLRHVEFNRRFLAANDAAMERYGKLWAKDTFRLWSRRWEYPYAAQRIEEFLRQSSVGATPALPGCSEREQRATQASPLQRILDAGSGVTYFPYYLFAQMPSAQITCCDSNPTYQPMFEKLKAANPSAQIRFVQCMLQNMPLDSDSFDAVCCISVLEHTSNYSEILREFDRVLRPGGLLVLTFDLSLDGRFELPRATAEQLVGEIGRRFVVYNGTDLMGELSRMEQRDQILSTDYIRNTQPDLLPWKHPILQAVYDLMKGYGWTGGFRSKSVYCLSVRALARDQA